MVAGDAYRNRNKNEIGPMKILHLAAFYGPHLGGVETHLKYLNQELIEQGHQVSVLTPQYDAKLPMSENLNGVAVTRFNNDNHYPSKLLNKLGTWQQVAKHSQLLLKSDIIHAHDVYWWLLPLLPLFWSKTYLTFHGWEGEFPIPWTHKFGRWLWGKLALKTIHVGDYIQEFYWDKPDEVIYGGVRASTKKTRSQKSKKKKIVFVGRLEAENDLEKYLVLAKKINATDQVEITWVGDGAYKEDCEKMGRVTGMVKNIDKYIAQADLVWSASYLSILEAQARGKIVAAFYSHQLKERYLKTYPGARYMLLSNDEEKLASQTKRLFDNPDLLIDYSQAAQEWARQQTWKKIANQYLQLWGRQ